MKKILLVDDEVNIVNSLRRLLKISGCEHHFEFLESSEAAVGYLKSEKFDALVTDLHMPVIDGLGLAEIAKVNNPDIKVIIMSGELEHNSFSGMEIDGQVSKPCEITELVDTINGVLL